MYQRVIKYPKSPNKKVFQMAIKYIYIFQSS
jgi:hypothetical protein